MKHALTKTHQWQIVKNTLIGDCWMPIGWHCSSPFGLCTVQLYFFGSHILTIGTLGAVAWQNDLDHGKTNGLLDWFAFDENASSDHNVVQWHATMMPCYVVVLLQLADMATTI